MQAHSALEDSEEDAGEPARGQTGYDQAAAHAVRFPILAVVAHYRTYILTIGRLVFDRGRQPSVTGYDVTPVSLSRPT
jgi:hypothetical protein